MASLKSLKFATGSPITDILAGVYEDKCLVGRGIPHYLVLELNKYFL